MGEGFWAGMAALATAVLGGLALLLAKWAEGRRAARKDALDEWQGYAANLRAQNERQQAVIEQHGRAVEALAGENANCREDAAEQRQAIHFLYDLLKRFHRTLKEDCGQDPGDLPELPPLRPRAAAGGTFLAAQAAQSAEALKQASGVIQPPGGAPSTS